MTVARLLVVGTTLLLAGCSTIFAVKEQQRRSETLAVVAGTVTTEQAARGPLVVALLSGPADAWVLVDYFVAPEPGPWVFGVEPGTYWVTVVFPWFLDRSGR